MRLRSLRAYFLLCLAAAPGATPAFAEDLVERLPVESTETLISARVSLLFEEKKKNDEDVDIVSPPRLEARDAVLQELSKDHWQVLIQLHEGDRERHPMLTCVIQTSSGAPLALPNRVLQTSDSEMEEGAVGTLDCVHDPTVLSARDIAQLSKEERLAFIRSREDDSKKFAAEINAELTDEVAQKIFVIERRLGIAPATPLSRKLTVEEIARRLVALESVWSVEKRAQ